MKSLRAIESWGRRCWTEKDRQVSRPPRLPRSRSLRVPAAIAAGAANAALAVRWVPVAARVAPLSCPPSERASRNSDCAGRTVPVEGLNLSSRDVGSPVCMSDPRRIIGLSTGPTDHILRRGGREDFLCCAIDLLLNAANGPVDGRTRCPSCGSGIRLKIDRMTIELLEPSDTLALVHEISSPQCEWEVVCSDSMLFDSDKCLTAWRSRHPSVEGIEYRVSEYLGRCCGPRQR